MTSGTARGVATIVETWNVTLPVCAAFFENRKRHVSELCDYVDQLTVFSHVRSSAYHSPVALCGIPGCLKVSEKLSRPVCGNFFTVKVIFKITWLVCVEKWHRKQIARSAVVCFRQMIAWKQSVHCVGASKIIYRLCQKSCLNFGSLWGHFTSPSHSEVDKLREASTRGL